MKKINLSFKNYSYPVIIDSIDYLKHVELKDYDKIFILCDRVIHNLYSKEKIFNSNFNVIIMDGNERNKSLVSFEKIINEATSKWNLLDCIIIHRYGKLYINNKIVLVSCFAKHRNDTFESCKFIMDYLKKDAPFWKNESYNNNNEWLINSN